MSKTRRGYRCSACSRESAAFAGRCPGCGSWNTLEPFTTTPAAVSARSDRGFVVPLADPAEQPDERYVTGLPEFDRVLGGGLVPGSLVLVGGEPGIGKSTLVLQAAALLAGAGHTVAYVCGEESPRQVRMRAARLGVAGASIDLVPETNLEVALGAAAGRQATVLVIDSIQSMYVEGLDARFAGTAQLSESGARLVSWAKANEVATIVTGHVTKGGEIAGPRLLEHMVDVVLYFESAEAGLVRILRAAKNRFGATDEVGVFEMTGEGLRSLENPSLAFLGTDALQASGCAATAVIEGSRPLAIEIQALAVPSSLSAPRRIASGLETARLHLLLAVLARRAGLVAAAQDVVVAVSGGLRLRDPGADLAVVAALASAINDRAVPPSTAFLGEVALSGAIRPVQQPLRRLQELQRLGFARCIVPRGTPPVVGVELVEARTVQDAIAAAGA